MIISANDILVLDTSVVVDLARDNRSGKAILEKYSLRSRADRPLISVITMGETLGIAKALAWATGKVQDLQKLLAEFVNVELSPDVIEAYSDLVLKQAYLFSF